MSYLFFSRQLLFLDHFRQFLLPRLQKTSSFLRLITHLALRSVSVNPIQLQGPRSEARKLLPHPTWKRLARAPRTAPGGPSLALRPLLRFGTLLRISSTCAPETRLSPSDLSPLRFDPELSRDLAPGDSPSTSRALSDFDPFLARSSSSTCAPTLLLCFRILWLVLFGRTTGASTRAFDRTFSTSAAWTSSRRLPVSSSWFATRQTSHRGGAGRGRASPSFKLAAPASVADGTPRNHTPDMPEFYDFEPSDGGYPQGRSACCSKEAPGKKVARIAEWRHAAPESWQVLLLPSPCHHFPHSSREGQLERTVPAGEARSHPVHGRGWGETVALGHSGEGHDRRVEPSS